MICDITCIPNWHIAYRVFYRHELYNTQLNGKENIQSNILLKLHCLILCRLLIRRRRIQTLVISIMLGLLCANYATNCTVISFKGQCGFLSCLSDVPVSAQGYTHLKADLVLQQRCLVFRYSLRNFDDQLRQNFRRILCIF